MAEIYRPQQQNSEETNPVLTGVSVAYHVIDASMKLAEVVIDEASGNYQEHTEHNQPVYVPQEQQVHEKEKPNRIAEQEASDAQHLAAIRRELGFLGQTEPASLQEPPLSNPVNTSSGISATPVALSE